MNLRESDTVPAPLQVEFGDAREGMQARRRAVLCEKAEPPEGALRSLSK